MRMNPETRERALLEEAQAIAESETGWRLEGTCNLKHPTLGVIFPKWFIGGIRVTAFTKRGDPLRGPKGNHVSFSTYAAAIRALTKRAADV